MINFNYKNKFRLKKSKKIKLWLIEICKNEGSKLNALSIVFGDDNFLLEFNKQYLNHDTLTDVITFDYGNTSEIHGDILISTERVKENAKDYGQLISNEVNRVMAHGLLHLLGYKDKTKKEKEIIRNKENKYLKTLNT
ncbi:MAG: rRNA maturation RNase YbeY [Flavobacteriales bacterium]|jgi:probable rRNA maturation factor|tara:strand:+ start:47714 stop:48127 length:414 start_codon:yes stop_codon:yes gene_type:complete